MSSESIRYECPPTCPKVKEYLRAKSTSLYRMFYQHIIKFF